MSASPDVRKSKRKFNSPWKHTDKDRGWMRRKARADARLAAHVYDATRCKDGCPKRPVAA